MSFPQPNSPEQKSSRRSKAWGFIVVALILILLVLAGRLDSNHAVTLLLNQATSGAPISTTISEALNPAGETRTPSKKPSKTPTPKSKQPTQAATIAANSNQNFDFYVLSLSWSPDYCATSGSSDSQQCSLGKKLGFVLHGLWPQYERGYPANCSNQTLPDTVKADYTGLYPSSSLFDHEWEKHGTCSGLSPQDYLALSKQLKQSVVIPDAYRTPEKAFRATSKQLEAAFEKANSDLSAEDIGVFCSSDGRFLKEVYVCFSLEGQPRACSAEINRNAAKSCQSADFLVRNVR